VIESPSDARLLTPAPPTGPRSEDRSGLADEELLGRYRRSRSPEDLAEISSRHRPMVFRTCLRMVGNAHDAEDATQSVFLALAQRPRIVRLSLVGGLHELARAAASELFRSRRRRARREQEATRRGPLLGRLGWAPGPTDRDELREELDVALGQLPDTLKQAVILRYVEGYSQQEAARRAGCTAVTMGWRSMKGLEKLRKILGRRGVGTAGGALVALLAIEAHSSAAPSVAVVATGKAATAQMAPALVRQFVLSSLLRKAAVGLAVTAPLAVVGVELRPRPAPRPPVVVAAPVLPPPANLSGLGLFERTLDIGEPGFAGGVSFADGRYTVQGGGARIYLDKDHFRFACRPWDGDGEVVARVASDPDQPGRQVAAGVMFRERLEADSLHVAMLVTSDESRATYRTPASLPNSNVKIDDLAARGMQWVRLVRRGDHFTMFVRPDASPDWSLIKELDVPMARSLFVGLAVTSNNDTKLSTATFDHVTFGGR